MKDVGLTMMFLVSKTTFHCLPLPKQKVAVSGPGDAGKSSWLKYVRCDEFTEKTQITQNSNRISFIDVRFEHGNPRHFRVQDLPGQTCSISFEDRSKLNAFLLISSIEKPGLRRFEQRTLKLFIAMRKADEISGGAAVCLVFTKADLLPVNESMLTTHQLIKKFRWALKQAHFNKVEVFIVSSKSGLSYTFDEEDCLVQKNDFGAKQPIVWLAQNLFKNGTDRNVTGIEGKLCEVGVDGELQEIEEKDEFKVVSNSN